MELLAEEYEKKAVKRESFSLLLLYPGVIIAAALLLFMTFRAAHQISLYKPRIDTALYTETHSYVVLIETIFWLVIARAATRFKSYAYSIRRSRDGVALDYIANAMLLSLAYAVLFGMASTFKTLFMGSQYLSLATTVSNLLPLAVFLIVSVLLYLGSRKLVRVLPEHVVNKDGKRSMVSLYFSMFGLFLVLFTHNFYHGVPQMFDDDGLRHFTLSPGILVFVYILPFAVVWLLGLLSCINLALYSKYVRGRLYRPMFRSLYLGLLISYMTTYLIQVFYASNIPSNRFGTGLVFLLSLFAALLAGYLLMYRGANQLYRLEQHY